MDGAGELLLKGLGSLRPGSSRIRFVSTVTGGALHGEEMGADYWWNNVRRPVLFGKALELLIRDGHALFVEVGPHPVLNTYIRQCLAAENVTGRAVQTLRRRQPEMPQVLSAIGRCYAAGCDLNLQSLFPMAVPPVSLPFYPWQRERHWNGGVFGAPGPQRGEFQHPLLGYRSASADPLWENEIDITELSYLGDHRVLGATLFPVAGFVEMALRAAQLARGGQAVTIENLNVHTPLTLTDNHSVRIQFSVCSEDGSFRIQSCGEDRSVWSLSASGRLGDAVGYKRPEPVLLDELRSRLPKRVTGAEFYRECEHRGLQYGPAFRRLEEVWAGANEALGQLSTGPEDSQNDYCLHPAVLDACLHLSVASVGADADQDEASYLGSQIRRFRLMVDGRKAAYCHARVERRSERSIVLNVLILDADGGVVAEAEGLRAVRVETTAVRSSALPVLEVRTLLQPAGTNGGGPAVALPEPDAIVQALASRPAPSVDEADPSHVRAWADEVCGLFAWEALEALGQDRKAAVPDQFALFDRLVEMAIEDGFPVRKTDAAVVTGDRPVWRAVEVWRRGVADFPAYLAECAILGLRGSALPHLLRGEAGPITENAVRIGASAIEHLFDQAPPARVAYSTVRGVMEEVVRQWPENELLRVLEIGGDGWPLAPHILPLLPSERTQYWFTHASETVRDRTAARLAGFSFARCGALDIMRELAGQAFEERGFDVVVAAGAFQEVSRAAETLPRVRELIRGGGLLVLVEPKPQRFFDIALGPQRLLSRRQWIGHLEESGFERVTTLGEPQDGVAALSVIVARNAPTGAQEIVKAAAPATKRTWIVLREETPEDEAAELPAHCAERLEQAGHRVIQLLPGTAYDRRGENLIVVPWNDADCVRRLFADLSAEGGHCDELIHGWGLTRKLPENADELMSLTSRRCVSALSLVQGLMRAELPHLPRLWLLTCGAMPVAPRAGGLCPAQSSLWGLGRVLAQETPALACKLVDLHWKNNPAGVLDRLLTELDETGAEDEILLTESARYVQRVYSTSIGRSAAASRVLEGEAACRLSLVKPGSADNLVLEGCARPAPDRGQVEIRVRAAGLNFHDLMWAMKLLPDEAVETGLAGPTLGMECAGEVVRVGDGVSEFRTGDAVIAGAPQCFGTHVLAAAAHTLPKPSGVSHEAAATVLTAFTTVVYALEHLGRLQPGERVLIHGAAGGVGLAAIQYAMHVGAEVIATAGTGEKREFLRLLGVPHVFSSRTPDYAEEILQATHGEGVDLVLNTLSGEAVPRSFSVLRPFGRFLELGKRDFIEHKRMAMAPFRNNLSYFGIDLDQAMAVRPGLRGTILPRVVELMSQGVLRPLPFRSFPASRAREAFRHMQKSQHIGKIVISFDDEDMRAVPAEGAILPLRPDGTYLITGGLSGLGLETARWMARKGARNLVLVGRSGAAAPEAAAAVEEIEANGCVVLAASADVADEGALRQLLVQVSERMPPLRGVVHAAMVLDDTLAPLMTAERFWHAARPKIPGAWNLHCLTIDSPLDFFVLYSSAATTLGTPGQANYVAGNLFLESLAQYRRSLGLVGTAISWGAISDTGYLARNTAVRETLENRLAVRPLSARQALRYLEQILVRDCANWIAADVNWRKLASTSPALVRSPRFGLLVGDETGAPSAEAVEDVRARLLALSPDEVRQAVSEILLNELARVVGGSAARIDPERPLAELGVDSLMAVELLTSIESRFHVQLSPLEIMGGGTLSQVARLIAGAVTAETVDQGEQASASVEAGLTAGRVSDP